VCSSRLVSNRVTGVYTNRDNDDLYKSPGVQVRSVGVHVQLFCLSRRVNTNLNRQVTSGTSCRIARAEKGKAVWRPEVGKKVGHCCGRRWAAS